MKFFLFKMKLFPLTKQNEYGQILRKTFDTMENIYLYKNFIGIFGYQDIHIVQKKIYTKNLKIR